MEPQKTELFYLCSHDSGSCCPSVEIRGEEVFIRDDFGGEIRLSRQQLELLHSRLVEGRIVKEGS